MARRKLKGTRVEAGLFDLKAYNEYITENKKELGDHQTRTRCFMPIGTNVAVDLHRKVEATPTRPGFHTTETIGHTLVANYYTLGVKVYVKCEMLDNAKRLIVFVEDESGMEIVSEHSVPS